jgi:hypothetical protein
MNGYTYRSTVAVMGGACMISLRRHGPAGHCADICSGSLLPW